MSTVANIENLAADLRHFSGGCDQYHHAFGRVRFTEGVKYLADRAGAYWLIDLIASHQTKRKLRAAPFQAWKLAVDVEKRCAVATCQEDSGERVICRQVIEYTDFPLPEMTLWLVDGCLMLPNEY